MKGAVSVLVRPAGMRKLTALSIVGGTAFLILLAVALLGLSMTAVTVALLLIAAAAGTLLRPEIGLFVLIVNALVGLTHLVDLPTLGPISAPVALEGVLALAFATQVAMRKKRTFLSSPQHWLLLILTFWIIVSMLVSGELDMENLNDLRSLYMVRFLIFLLVTNILVSRDAMERLLWILAGSNVGLLGFSVATRIGLFGADRIVISQRMMRTSGLVHNPNNLAFELTTMLILAVCMFFYVKSRWLKSFFLLLAMSNGLVILSTLSRSGFISLIVVLVFLFFVLTRNAKVVAVVLLLTVGIGLISFSNLASRFKRIDEIKDVDRWSIAVVGFNTTYHNPVFGVGLGNFLKTFDRYDTMDVRNPMPTHNMYLDLSSQMGIPALALYLGVIGVTWWRLLLMGRALKRKNAMHSFHYIFGLALQCFLVNLCVFGLSGDVEFEYSVFIMLGFAILLHRDYKIQSAHERIRRRKQQDEAGKALRPMPAAV